MNQSNSAKDKMPSEGEVENSVLIGREGWIFLWEGANEVNRYYTEKNFLSEEIVSRWRKLISSRVNILSKLGTRYIHLIAPDKMSVYPEYITQPVPYLDKIPSKRFAREFSKSKYYLDVLPLFFSSADRIYCYYKTDTHWTATGAEIAYSALCAKLGVAPIDFTDRPVSGGDMVFDLGNKLNAQPVERARFRMVLKEAKRIAENELVRFTESPNRVGAAKLVGSYVCYRNDAPSANPQKVVIFGNSFSEYRPYLLTGMLAETFREVHFIWSTSIDFNFVERVRPDILITEIAERFVNTVPADDFTMEMDSKSSFTSAP